MALFLAISLILGGISGLFFTWIFVAIASACLAVPCIAVLLLNGAGVGASVGYALLALILLQGGYLLVSIVASLLKPMRPPSDGLTAPGGGNAMPMLRVVDASCKPDGAPWDGLNDPEFRMKLLVLGWRDHAVSVALTKPKRAAAAAKASGLNAQAPPRLSLTEDGR